MKTISMALALAAALGFCASASAQMSGDQMNNGMNSSSSSMSSGKGMPMSSADTKKWQKCQMMSNDMMMKDKKCMSLKKKNDMMK